MPNILSLDPSLSAIGFCILDIDADAIIHHGVFKPSGSDLDSKLASAFEWLKTLFDELPPIDIFAIEIGIYAKNVDTLRKLSYLTGVLRLAAWTYNARIIPILPQARRIAVGIPIRMKSKPAKQAIIGIVNARFGLELKPAQHDVADAIAVALAAAKKLKLEEEPSCP